MVRNIYNRCGMYSVIWLLAAAMLTPNVALASPQSDVQAYNITESYLGGTMTLNFSIDLAQTPITISPPGGTTIEVFNFVAASVFYTGEALPFEPSLIGSTYQQAATPGAGSSALLELSALGGGYSGVIDLTAEFSDVGVPVVLGAVDAGGSFLRANTQNIDFTSGGPVMSGTASPAVIPEPACVAIIGVGLAGLAARRRARTA